MADHVTADISPCSPQNLDVEQEHQPQVVKDATKIELQSDTGCHLEITDLTSEIHAQAKYKVMSDLEENSEACPCKRKRVSSLSSEESVNGTDQILTTESLPANCASGSNRFAAESLAVTDTDELSQSLAQNGIGKDGILAESVIVSDGDRIAAESVIVSDGDRSTVETLGVVGVSEICNESVAGEKEKGFHEGSVFSSLTKQLHNCGEHSVSLVQNERTHDINTKNSDHLTREFWLDEENQFDDKFNSVSPKIPSSENNRLEAWSGLDEAGTRSCDQPYTESWRSFTANNKISLGISHKHLYSANSKGENSELSSLVKNPGQQSNTYILEKEAELERPSLLPRTSDDHTVCSQQSPSVMFNTVVWRSKENLSTCIVNPFNKSSMDSMEVSTEVSCNGISCSDDVTFTSEHLPMSVSPCQHSEVIEREVITDQLTVNQTEMSTADTNNVSVFGDCFHINSLPSSILIQIFQNLSVYDLLLRAGLVCRLWHQLCRDADIWRQVNLRFQLKVSDSELLSILSFSDRVLHLDISDNRLVTDVGLTFAMKKCCQLTTLRLTRCFKLKDDGFKAIGIYCHQLAELFLDGCYSITDNAIAVIAEGCPKLRCLHLNQCGKISDTGVVALAQNCHLLRQLLLDHCPKVTDTSAAELAQGCPELKILSVMACGLTDTGIKNFTQLKKLELLEISNIPKLTPHGVVDIARGCSELECLNISLNPIVDDNCVDVIAKCCSKLRRLFCVSCSLTDKALVSLGTYSKTIQTLDIGWCKEITDEGVRAISKTCPSLRFLGLIRCDHVTIDTMEALIVQYPHIKYSTFVLESRKLLERARQEGFHFSGDPVTG